MITMLGQSSKHKAWWDRNVKPFGDSGGLWWHYALQHREVDRECRYTSTYIIPSLIYRSYSVIVALHLSYGWVFLFCGIRIAESHDIGRNLRNGVERKFNILRKAGSEGRA